MKYRPKIYIRNSLTREWQQVLQISYAQHDVQNNYFSMRFPANIMNQNLIQQLRRVANGRRSSRPKVIEYTNYPEPGKSQRVQLKVRVAVVRERSRVVEVSGVVDSYEMLEGERR